MLPLIIDEDLLGDLKEVENNLNEAGTIVGVGAFRVERNGWFGRFTAKMVK